MPEPLTAEEVIQVVTRRDGRVFLIGMTQRVGLTAFIAAIEWYWYTPGTPRNRFFDVYFTEWEDIHYVIAAFPIGRLDAARRLAKQLGLRIGNGVPTMVQVAGAGVSGSTGYPPGHPLEGLIPTFFPGGVLPNGRDNTAMFTVENDKGSPVYRNRIRENDGMLRAGHEINEALNRGVRLTPAQIADYIYGPGFPLA
jgi:hypothetical protein